MLTRQYVSRQKCSMKKEKGLVRSAKAFLKGSRAPMELRTAGAA
jgi:hypothetical protein